jgi:hypothetical protein
MGQLAYFIEFLTLTGLWSGWQDRCPLSYTSPNAPDKADVLGTWMLSILSGHRRYSHVTTIRCDGVNPGLLGMNKVISEDALRRALLAIPADAGVSDTTIKPLYGKQEGAVVSYNPKKPGRPSHSYHTYLMAGLRLVMGVDVKAGNEHSGSHTLPGLLRILDELPADRRPKMVRGDCGFGADGIMGELEARAQPYLFVEERQAPHRAPVPCLGLVRCRSGLGRDRQHAGAHRLGGQAPRGRIAPPLAGRDAPRPGGGEWAAMAGLHRG